MKKLLALLLLSPLVAGEECVGLPGKEFHECLKGEMSSTPASNDIYLDCSHEYDVTNGSRSMDFIRINTTSNYVHQYDFLLIYKKNPDYYCSWNDSKKCEKKGIPKYIDGYTDKFGDVNFTINKTLTTHTNAYSWTIEFPCCGSAWSAYKDTNGVTTRAVTRDTLKYYGSITWPEKSVQSCQILDKNKFNQEVEYYQSRWKKLSEKAAEEQIKKNKI